jgi:ubiquinol-cytochrome c reductase cytochrome b subunit
MTAQHTLAFLGRIKWGAWSLVCLYISLASGVLVALQYDPAAPYYSTAGMDLLVPFGAYFRSLHFYSSQLFFLLAIVHLAVVYPVTDSYTTVQWARLISCLPVMLLLLFTGYVLRADTTGSSAGAIAEAILTSIPIIGPGLNNTFFGIADHGMQRVYVAHLITFDLLWLMLAWEHLRRYRIRLADYLPVTGAVLLLSVFVAAPIDPDKLGVSYITGPWFFLGLQELLRYLPPLVAGVLFPAFLLLALFLTHRRYRFFKGMLTVIAIWLALYLALSLASLRH